jgi:hypothetical protein
MMQSGQTINLFELKSGEDCTMTVEKLKAGLGRASIRVEYESLYGEKFVFS